MSNKIQSERKKRETQVTSSEYQQLHSDNREKMPLVLKQSNIAYKYTLFPLHQSLKNDTRHCILHRVGWNKWRDRLMDVMFCEIVIFEACKTVRKIVEIDGTDCCLYEAPKSPNEV